MKPIAIIGVGNLLMGDEGVGIHAIAHLRRFDWPEDAELIDAGVPGPSLLHIISGRRLSIIIDCADFGGKPGEILVVDARQLKKPDENIASLHGTTLPGTLKLAEMANIETGRVVLICIQPEAIRMSENLSEKVSDTFPAIRSEVVKLIIQTERQ